MGKTAVHDRILLVEDDSRFRTLVRCTLGERGIEVVEAESTARAKKLFRKQAFDLLIVDGLLPDGSGVDFIEWARREGYAGPIFFVSHFYRDLPTFRKLKEQWSVTRVLSKPLTAAQLLIEVDAALGPAPTQPGEAGDPAASTSEAPDGFERELSRLRKGYAEQFPEALADVCRRMTEARRAPGDKDRLAVAHRAVHSLAGSAGSFGFRAVGETLRAVELRVQEIVESAGEIPEDAWEPVEATLEHALDCFEQEWDWLRSRAPEAGAASQPREPELPHHVTRVLVVDDDPNVLVSLGLVGRQHLIEVVPAHSTQEALEQARSHEIDGAVLDVYLEDGESGFDVARQLRALPGMADLPLAFFSRDASLENRVKAAHAGGSLFLDKSDTSEEFAEAVRHLAALRRESRPKVCILGADPREGGTLADELDAGGIDVLWTNDPTTLLEALEESRPDALLVELMLGGVSGFDVCKMLRTTPRWRDLPIVLLMPSDGREVRRACFEAGADDYMSIPVRIDELLARLTLLMERIRLQRDRAERDALTGLLLRGAFMDRFRSRLTEAQRDQQMLAVCLLDLDHFKQHNDRFGHEAGDRVLAALGKLLGVRLRPFDIRGRWGGEEFVVAIYGEPPGVAEKVVQRILDEFQAMEFESEGRVFQASFSAGIATYPNDGRDFAALFRVADACLYRAKEAGRSRVELGDGPKPAAG